MSRRIKTGVRVALALNCEEYERLRYIVYAEHTSIQQLLKEGFDLMAAKRAPSEKLPKSARRASQRESANA